MDFFLIKSKQCVRNEIVESNWPIINHGLPQGAVLGQLVFILYVNKFGVKIGKRSNVFQFADDTAILGHEKMKSA